MLRFRWWLPRSWSFFSGPAWPGPEDIYVQLSDVDLNLRNLLRNLLRSPSGAVAPSSRRAAWKKGGQEASRNIWNMELKDDMVWYDLIWYYDIYIYVTFRYCKSGKSGTHFCVQNWNPKIAWNKTSFTIIFPVENAPQVGLSIHLFHKDDEKFTTHHLTFISHHKICIIHPNPNSLKHLKSKLKNPSKFKNHLKYHNCFKPVHKIYQKWRNTKSNSSPVLSSNSGARSCSWPPHRRRRPSPHRFWATTTWATWLAPASSAPGRCVGLGSPERGHRPGKMAKGWRKTGKQWKTVGKTIGRQLRIKESWGKGWKKWKMMWMAFVESWRTSEHGIACMEIEVLMNIRAPTNWITVKIAKNDECDVEYWLAMAICCLDFQIQTLPVGACCTSLETSCLPLSLRRNNFNNKASTVTAAGRSHCTCSWHQRRWHGVFSAAAKPEMSRAASHIPAKLFQQYVHAAMRTSSQKKHLRKSKDLATVASWLSLIHTY